MFFMWQSSLVNKYDLFGNPAECFINWEVMRFESTPFSAQLLSITGIAYYLNDLYFIFTVGKIQLSGFP